MEGTLLMMTRQPSDLGDALLVRTATIQPVIGRHMSGIHRRTPLACTQTDSENLIGIVRPMFQQVW